MNIIIGKTTDEQRFSFEIDLFRINTIFLYM